RARAGDPSPIPAHRTPRLAGSRESHADRSDHSIIVVMLARLLPVVASACWTQEPPVVETPQPWLWSQMVQRADRPGTYELAGKHGTYLLAAVATPIHGSLPSCGEPARTCLDIAAFAVRFESDDRVYVNDQRWPVQPFALGGRDAIIAMYPHST